jgi:Glycosyl hydrolase catalytic core
MRRTIGLAGLLTAVALTLPASGAEAAGRDFWGVNYTSATSGRDFKVMRRGHVGAARFVLWHSVVQASGWGPYDQLIAGLAKRRIRPLPDLFNSADYIPPVSGGARTAWVQFVHDAASRYGPGGTFWRAHPGLPNTPVRAMQVGNEPNLPKYFVTSTPVRDYATLLKITHSAIRSVSGKIKVVLAGMPALRSQFVKFPGIQFLNRLYRVHGVKRSFDIAATHPYAENLRQLHRALNGVRRVMKRHGDRRAPVWITEMGYGSDRFNHHLNFGLRGQATMLRKTFKLILHGRKRWKVHGVVWYDWRDPPQRNPDCSFCSSAGLLRSSFRPKPAYHAFKHIAGSHR